MTLNQQIRESDFLPDVAASYFTFRFAAHYFQAIVRPVIDGPLITLFLPLQRVDSEAAFDGSTTALAHDAYILL